MNSLPSKVSAPPPYNSLYPGHEEEQSVPNEEINNSESYIHDDVIDGRISKFSPLESLITEIRKKVETIAKDILQNMHPGSDLQFTREEKFIYEFMIQSTLQSSNISNEAMFYKDSIPNDASIKLWRAEEDSSGIFINIDYVFSDGKQILNCSKQFLEISKGICIHEKFVKHGERFQPISTHEFSLCDILVIEANEYFNHHICKAQADSQLLEQLQQISLIPVYKIIYKIRDETKHFSLVGSELSFLLPPHDILS